MLDLSNRTVVAATVVCALLAAAALTACGSDDRRERSALAAARHEPPIRSAGDEAIAENALVTLADFPRGWTRSAGSAPLKPRCDAVAAARRRASGIAESPTFVMGDNAQAVTGMLMFADQAAAGRAFNAISGRDTRRCWARTVSRSVSGIKGATLRGVTITRLSVRPRADQAAAARITVAVTVNGGDVDLHVDLVFVRSGRGVSLGAFVDAPIPFDAALRDELTADQVRRLAEGLV